QVPPASDNLGLQLLVQLSNWFGEVSDQLANAARTVTDFQFIAASLLRLATNPRVHHVLLEAAWKLALALACALAAGSIIRRVVGRPLAMIARCTPAGSRRSETPAQEAQQEPHEPPPQIGREPRRQPFGLLYTWQLLLRLPFVLGRLF